jgi:hypothetical protein
MLYLEWRKKENLDKMSTFKPQIGKIDVKLANDKFIGEFTTTGTSGWDDFKSVKLENAADSIILVIYVGLKGVNSKPRMIQHMAETKNAYDSYSRHPGIISYFVPAMDEINTRIECINPKIVNPEEYKNAQLVLDRAQKCLDDFIGAGSKIKNEIEKL